MPKVSIARAEDWEGLYVDGKLIDEGHSIQLEDALKAAAADFEIFWVSAKYYKELVENRCFCNLLKDVGRQS